jgi:hypothetical protein
LTSRDALQRKADKQENDGKQCRAFHSHSAIRFAVAGRLLSKPAQVHIVTVRDLSPDKLFEKPMAAAS